MAGSGWEKVFFAGAVLLIAGLAIGGLFMLITSALGGGSQKEVSAIAPRATATRPGVTPTRTAIVIGVPTLPTAKPTDRSRCDLIKGTPYNSDTERQFYETNCVTPTAQPTGTATPGRGHGGPPTEPPPPPPPPPPTEPPPPPPPPPTAEFTASDAINAGVYWMRQSGYTVDRAGCNAVHAGNHWVVTCPTNSGSVSVCVFEDPLRVAPSNEC